MAKQIRGDILLRREGRVLRVTINRSEKHNPLSRAVLADLREVFDSMRKESDLA